MYRYLFAVAACTRGGSKWTGPLIAALTHRFTGPLVVASGVIYGDRRADTAHARGVSRGAVGGGGKMFSQLDSRA